MTTTHHEDDVLRAQAHEVRPGDSVSLPGLISSPLLVEAIHGRDLDGETFTELTLWPGAAAGPGVGLVSVTVAHVYPVAIHDRVGGF